MCKTEETAAPDDHEPRDRLSSALIRMRGICAVLTDLAEGDRDGPVANFFRPVCEPRERAG